MKENRRILLNIVATYGRSLFSLACGIVTGRWALMSLGQSDYGLVGVVGGLSGFVVFFNSILAGAVGRFYAISVGQARIDKGAGLEECRKWFSTAVLVHTVVPTCLLLIGYPIGIWAIENFLVIPPDRIGACIWVFRISCVSCFICMANVPIAAMYTAKQYIAELTVYGFVGSACNVVFLWYMVNHPGTWIVRYAAWGALMVCVPQILIAIRGFYVFEECKFRLYYCFDLSRIKKLFGYSTWQLFGGVANMLRGEGVSVLVNKYFGPCINASMAVANTVYGQTTSLSAAMQGAFMPAITTAYGAGDLEKMKKMSYQACKFGMLLSLIFMIPLSLELPLVFKLWLKDPPDCVSGLCLCMMIMFLVDKSTLGHMVSVNAKGKIALYQTVLGGALLMTLPLAWLLVHYVNHVYAVGVAMIVATAACAWGRLYFAKKLVGLSPVYWLFHIMVPVVLTIAISGTVGWCVRLLFDPSLIRIALTTVVSDGVFVLLTWLFVLDVGERAFVLDKIHRLINKAFK